MTKFLHTGRVLLGLVLLLACSTVHASDLEIPLITVGDASYATCYLPFGVSEISGATAYVDDGIEDGCLILKEVSDVAAETGFVLIGDADVTTATLTIGVSTTQGSGVLTGTCVATSSEGKLVLGIKKGTKNQIGFFKYTGETIPANKAYIDNSDGTYSTVRLAFNDNTTGINGIIFKTREEQEAPIYDLSGRRISKPAKGVYIQGGKKYIAR